MSATLSSQDLWYVSRGSGLVLLVVLNLVVGLGVAVRAGWAPASAPRFVVEGLHRNASLLAVALLAIHVLSAVTDPYVTIGWAGALVPFTSHYRSLWIACGALSLDLLGAVVVTSLLRRHLGRRAWRGVHLLAYLSWPLAFVHSLKAGNDVSIAWVRIAVVVPSALAALAVLVSFAARQPMHSRRSLPAGEALGAREVTSRERVGR